MESISIGTLVALAGVVTAIGGAWLTVRKIQKDHNDEKELVAAKILSEAKEQDALIRAELEARMSALQIQVETLESSVNKDLEHIRQTYNGEIRNLGQKIEDLRSELRNQHGQLVGLLTKMIENR